MLHKKLFVGVLAVTVSIFAGCASVPVSGKSGKKAKSVPVSELVELGTNNFSQFIKKVRLTQTYADAKILKQTGLKLSGVVEQYLKENGRESEIEYYKKWEFALVDKSRAIDAFSFPCGKIVVYSGMLPTTKNSDGLAVIVGHSVAHVLLNHPGQRMGELLKLKMEGKSLADAIKENPEGVDQIFLEACGVENSTGTVMSYTLEQENEADALGLVLIAKAGFFAEAAPRVWKKLLEKDAKNKLRFLAVHPVNDQRLEGIDKALVEAQKYNKLEVK
jgi:predicted Zn-dependent protease